MLTFRYSKAHPDGKLFDTEGREAEYPPPELNGWFDCRSKIHVTQDELIDAYVRRTLAEQPSDRDELDAEFRKKTGDTPHFAAREETIVKVLDDPHSKRKGGRK